MGLLLRLKVEGDRVHAIPFIGGRGTVVKDMAQVGAAAGAADFDAIHAIGMVVEIDDAVWADGFEEAGPAAGARELGVGAE